MGNQRLDQAAVVSLADLPSIEVLRGKLLGVLQAPAQKLAALINTPGSQLARVIKAKADKGE
jgi:large subunit ribosomal protein L10